MPCFLCCSIYRELIPLLGMQVQTDKEHIGITDIRQQRGYSLVATEYRRMEDMVTEIENSEFNIAPDQTTPLESAFLSFLNFTAIQFGAL